MDDVTPVEAPPTAAPASCDEEGAWPVEDEEELLTAAEEGVEEEEGVVPLDDSSCRSCDRVVAWK